MAIEFEKEEYFALVKSITDADQRLLTVKGWGVTLSLVALGLGFQHRAYGFFLIAAISSLAFWIVEHAGRRHLMRHYVRLREIEVVQYERAGRAELRGDGKVTQSSPRIDWSWSQAPMVLGGITTSSREGPVVPRCKNPWYRWAWALPHVALPHVLTLIVGAALAWLGHCGALEGFALGVPPTTH